MAIKEFVLLFMQAKGKISGNTEDAQLSCKYLDEQIIDSMGIIEMITQFEDKFGIRFSPEDMQSKEFRTIGGVINIIDRLKNMKMNE